jgi:hypothetical protein
MSITMQSLYFGRPTMATVIGAGWSLGGLSPFDRSRMARIVMRQPGLGIYRPHIYPALEA